MKSNTVVLLLVAVVLGLGILALEQGMFTPAEQEEGWQDTTWEAEPEGREEEPVEEEVVPHEDVGKGYQGALDAARASDKDVLIFFTADWCSYCQRMKNETLSNERVKKSMEKYVFYMCDTDEEPNIAKSYGVKGIPAYFIVNAEKSTVEAPQVVKSGKGYLGATSFLAWLNVKPEHGLPWRR